MPKVEHLVYGDRKVFTVSAFNRGIGMHLGRLPALWVEGRGHRAPAQRRLGERLPDAEGPEDRRDAQRHDRAAHVRPPRARPRRRGDRPRRRSRRDLRAEGGARPPGDDDRADRSRRAPARARAAQAQARRRRPVRAGAEAPPPARSASGRDPHRRGRRCARRPRRDDRRALPGDEGRDLRDAGAGEGRRGAIVAALAELPSHPEVDVVVLARGGGSFEDLLPFSDESVVRAVAASRVPIVSAVGHEQDTPLCDLAADARAATPTAAGALVVPQHRRARAGSGRDAATAGARGARAARARAARLERQGERLRSGSATPARTPARRARSLRRAAAGTLAARDAEPRLRDRPRGRRRLAHRSRRRTPATASTSSSRRGRSARDVDEVRP